MPILVVPNPISPSSSIFLSHRRHFSSPHHFFSSSSSLTKSSSFRTISSSSSSSPTVTTEDDDSLSPTEGTVSPQTQQPTIGSPDDPQFRMCKTCGKEEIERGCNGEGRIQGGIATVPGFGWWPIKAFRPCPGFTASGGRYRRRGQSMDEVTSGGARRDVTVKSIDKAKLSNERKGPKRLQG